MLKVASKRATTTANSYANVAFADTHFNLYIDSLWEALELEEKEASLIKASTYIDGHYEFIGQIKSVSQFLAWPRISATDSDGRLHDGIPSRLKEATCELALESALSGLDKPLTDKDFIQSKSQGVMGIDEKIEYGANKPAGPVFPKIDGLLRPLIKQESNVHIFKLRR